MSKEAGHDNSLHWTFPNRFGNLVTSCTGLDVICLIALQYYHEGGQALDTPEIFMHNQLQHCPRKPETRWRWQIIGCWGAFPSSCMYMFGHSLSDFA